ncbi:RNA degradosome polyphosphate kinase [Aquihabitans sp. G128]|uniref:RNA degradosome polyphosphate kinase n=1 Tax=Aquihabitans sp. G128 TaxID=2849779 RepID=UPI001C235428|nr:RNA degradosome polyphosphate kinase [Aquihabitans sp. G128]QXC60441.1 RNA degradosome polyphosphate kinase [Aquihabitans sp. G128]
MDTVADDAPVAAPAGFTPISDDPKRFLNRELSWLDFNARVLESAADPETPLLERAKFCAIFSQNLDEFFQVRVAGLADQVIAGVGRTSADGLSPSETLRAVADRVGELVDRAEHLFLDRIVPALAEVGIVFSSWDQLDDDDRAYLVDEFESRIFPVLTPLAVDPGHPFPYISSLSLNLAVVLRDPFNGERRFARVKVPPLLPRFVVMPDGERFVPLEQVIASHLDRLFPGMEVVETFAFRVTRNADLTLEEEEADDLLAAVEMELRRRRFGVAVRLEVDARVTPEVRELLVRELDLTEDAVHESVGPLDLGGLWALRELDRPDLKDPPFTPVTQARLAANDDEKVDIFKVILDGDVLVHHPYDSFHTSVEEFVRQASRDPKVLAIKLTLYRTSGDSSIIKSLVRAAERGKQVAALVELKARFDEAANIGWARALETAGVHVTYGLVGLKTHTKTALVVRDEGSGVRSYCHIGTGNYNAKTAKLYEDLGILTADPVIGADLAQLFNYLTGYGRDVQYRRLLVAPHPLRSRLLELIDGEVAASRAVPGSGRIVMKMNSLVDPVSIDRLYAASQAGVEIDLVVRGICCLRPGVEGLSERIRVRSIIGRYLEHSRIFRFANGNGVGEPVTYIGSADLMPRNLDRRIEALVPVVDPALQRRIGEIIDVNLADDTLAWDLGPEGTWSHVPRVETVDAHLRFQELAQARARRTDTPRPL